MDSFQGYADFSKFVTKPIEVLLKERGEAIGNFRSKIIRHAEEIKGEIRKHRQTHTNRRSSDLYVISIKSILEYFKQNPRPKLLKRCIEKMKKIRI